MSTTKHLIALALLPAMITACSSDDPIPDTTSTLIWSSCSTESALECATLKVPSAYNAQSSEKIDIAISRLSATDQPAKGVLLLNPGGPGSPGLELLESIEGATFPENIRASFDLIGFDPRGVGQSTPVDCSEFGIDSTDQYVLNRSEIESLVNQTSSIAEKCFEKYGDYLQQLGSLKNEQSDVFAESALSLAASCTGWPEAVDPLPEITTNTAPVSLVIGG